MKIRCTSKKEMIMGIARRRVAGLALSALAATGIAVATAPAAQAAVRHGSFHSQQACQQWANANLTNWWCSPEQYGGQLIWVAYTP